MMNTIECAVPAPKVEVIIDRTAGRQVLGECPPLATGAQYVHDGVDNLSQVDSAPPPTMLSSRDQRGDQSPFRVR